MRRGSCRPALVACAAAVLVALSSSTAAAVTIPDAYTPVVVRVLEPPTFPFKGTDGRYHIVYDLELQNASATVPATIDKLEVLDAAKPSRIVVSFSGTALVQPGCSFGNCNRLRRIGLAARVDDTTIPPQEGRLLFVDFAFDKLRQTPKRVIHRVFVHGEAKPGAREPTALDYLAAPYDISAGKPLVIGPPVRGDGWMAMNGCCEPGFPHRSAPGPWNGKLNNAQLFAIDWKRMNDRGAFYEGDRTSNDSYVDYGEPILAVADGIVVSTLDELEPNAPGLLPANDPVLAAQLTFDTVDGNHIVLKLAPHVYAFYAHLQKGTITVAKGDRVRQGQVIARLGNSGNANVSHLHFHLMDGASILGSNAVPYLIDRFAYDGQVSRQAIVDTDDYLSGTFDQGRLPRPEPRTREYPLAFAIINFPE